MANGAPLLVGALAVALTASEGPAVGLPRALAYLVALYTGAWAVHVLLRLLQFQGDQLVVPILCLLCLIGGIYHLGLAEPGGRGYSIQTYLGDVLVAWAVIGG